jgi:hypothetical protein
MTSDRSVSRSASLGPPSVSLLGRRTLHARASTCWYAALQMAMIVRPQPLRKAPSTIIVNSVTWNEFVTEPDNLHRRGLNWCKMRTDALLDRERDSARQAHTLSSWMPLACESFECKTRFVGATIRACTRLMLTACGNETTRQSIQVYSHVSRQRRVFT